MSKLLWISATLMACTAFAQVQINEILASNQSGLQDPDFNQTSDWIELKNTTSSSVNISGYYLSDSETTALKWQVPQGTSIPANGYLVLYADGENTGLHTNFKLSSAGEPLSLFKSDQTLLDQVEFPVQFADQSYGRNGSGAWVYMPNVTPGSGNNTSSTFTNYAPTPDLSPAPGIYTSAQSVSLSIPLGTTVHYTTDGSEPTTSSPIYSSPIQVSSTTVIKAIAVESGKGNSHQTMGTYLFGVDSDLEIISLTAEHYDSTAWPNGNLNIDGRVRVDWIEADKSIGFSQYADFALSGNSSKDHPQLNGKLYSNEKYGQAYFNYPIFPNKNLPQIESFLLRNSSQDIYWAHMRDAYASRLFSQDNLMDIPFEDFRPVALYVNGVYDGLVHVREDDDKYYAKQNFGQSKGTYQKVRVAQISNLSQEDIQTAEGLQEYKDGYANIQELNLYYSFLHFTGQGEEGGRMWRDSLTETPWRLHNHDWDQIFTWDYDYFGLSAVGMYSLAYFHSEIKDDYFQQIAAQLNFMFNRPRLLEIFDNHYNEIVAEMPAHLARMKAKGVVHDPTYKTNPTNMAQWQYHVDTLRSVLDKRTAAYWQEMIQDEGQALYTIDYETNDLNMGAIRFHGVLANQVSGSADFFAGLPLRLEAAPKPGYRFVRWEGALTGSTQAQERTWSSNQSLKAIFEKDPNVSLAQEVQYPPTELSYLASSAELRVQGRAIQSVELLNPKGKTIKSHTQVGQELYWNLKDIQAGNYYVRVTTAHEGAQLKPIIIH